MTHKGPVLNPFNKERSAGGSSSGSGVVVATGEADMAVGQYIQFIQKYTQIVLLFLASINLYGKH